MSKGILYIAHGERYLKEVAISAESVKKYNPSLKITLFTDSNITVPFVDDVQLIKAKTIRAKVYCMYDSPYDETCFLDSDIIVSYPIDDMFEIFPKYDMGGVHDLARKRDKYSKMMPEYGKIPYAVSEINTGMLLFKKSEKVKAMFDDWEKYHKKYYKLCPYDQPSFRISMWENDINFCSLPVEYNIRSKQNRDKQFRFHDEFGQDHLTPRIYHMHYDGKECLEDAFNFCKDNYQPY